ncbi:MAG: hypothetical protein AB1422_03305 [bacterium]
MWKERKEGRGKNLSNLSNKVVERKTQQSKMIRYIMYLVKLNIILRVKRVGFAVTFLLIVIGKAFADSHNIENLMMRADELYSQRNALSNAEESYLKYEEITKIIPKNFDSHWKLARNIWYLGDFSPPKKRDEKIFMYKKGIEIAKRAVEIASDRAEGYFWLGVMYGLYGETKGILQSLFLVDDIREALNKSLAIDPTVEGGGAYRVLGRMEYKLPEFAGGSKKRSLEYLLKAKEICPTAPWTYIYLADTYLALKDKNLAIKSLKELISIIPDLRWIPETKKYKEVAKEMLKRIGE